MDLERLRPWQWWRSRGGCSCRCWLPVSIVVRAHTHRDCITGWDVIFLDILHLAVPADRSVHASLSAAIGYSDKKTTLAEHLIDQQVVSWRSVWYTNSVRLRYSKRIQAKSQSGVCRHAMNLHKSLLLNPNLCMGKNQSLQLNITSAIANDYHISSCLLFCAPWM